MIMAKKSGSVDSVIWLFAYLACLGILHAWVINTCALAQNIFFLTVILSLCSQYFINCSGTTYEVVALLTGPLVGTPEFYASSSVILWCIYVAGLIEAGCYYHVWCCVFPAVDMSPAMFMSFCVCSLRWVESHSFVISVSPNYLLVWW